jgi:hypothetical protein
VPPTCDLQEYCLYPRRVRRHLTFVVALIAAGHVLDLQAPIIGVSETEGDPLIRAVCMATHR